MTSTPRGGQLAHPSDTSLLAQANAVLLHQQSLGAAACTAIKVVGFSGGWLAVMVTDAGGGGYVIFTTVNGHLEYFDGGTSFQVSDMTQQGVPAVIQAAVTGKTTAQILQAQRAGAITVTGMSTLINVGLPPNTEAALPSLLTSYFANHQLDGSTVSSMKFTNGAQTIPKPPTFDTIFTATVVFNGDSTFTRTLHFGVDSDGNIFSITLTKPGVATVTIK